MEYNATLAVDIALFSKIKNELHVLLIKRKNKPFKLMHALAGGMVEKDERIQKTAERELEEETGIRNIRLVHFNTYTNPGRDPRGRVISFAFTAIVESEKIRLKPGSDAQSAEWLPVKNLPELAFDHNQIILDAIDFLKQ